MDERVVVVGAGPAGLAAAWAIRRAGADPLIVEKAAAVAASWRARHDQLRLNTHRMFSHQPGLRIPRRYGPFSARDDYVAYLEQYAAGMRVKFGTAVGRIDRASAYTTTGDYWLTASGIPFVVALLATTAGIHNLHRGRDGLPGRAGVILTGAAMTGFLVAFTAGLITRQTQALGPIYPICVAASLAGLVIFTIGMIRARLLPWWTGQALVTGWLAGGPLDAFAAAPLLLAAVYATIAILLRKEITSR
jgi:hypothetical protein